MTSSPLRRLRVLLLLLAGLVPAAVGAQAQTVWSVDREQVNVRADATTQSARLAVLQRGQEVVELRRVGRWLEVRMSAGDTGWIHGSLLRARLVVEGQGLRLRESPSPGGTSVTMLFRGQEVDRLAENGDWTQVQLRDGQSGWVAGRFVRPKTAADLAAQRPAATAPAVPEVAPERASEPASEPAGQPVADGEAPDEFAILKRSPYAEGLQHEASGEHAEALARFEEVLAEDPAHINALVHAAQAHRQLGAYDAALDKLYRALIASGGRRDIYLILGEVYRLQAQPDSAAKYQALWRGETPPVTGTDPGQTADAASPTPAAETAAEPQVDGAFAEASAGPEVSPARRPREAEPDEVERGSTSSFLDTPWMPIGLAGIGLLALAGVGWWVVSTTSERNRKAGARRFQKVYSDEASQAEQGKATPEEAAELDRQIDARWRELKESQASFQETGDAAGDVAGDEGMDGILGQVEGLRRTLENQDERERLYADIVRLQNMKIDAMTEEIRRLRKR